MKAFLRRLVAQQMERRVQQVIAEHNVKVVAVTGSIGKTSTKLAVAGVLKQKYRVLSHQGNFNSEIGLPLSVFELDVPETLTNPIAWLKVLRQMDEKIKPFPYDVLVLELGADQPNDIQKFMRYLQPDIGIVTAIASAHIEQFGSIEALAFEKMSLARGSRAVLLNAENQRVMEEAERLGAPVQTYGVEKGGVHWRQIKRGDDLTLSGKLVLNNDELSCATSYIGRHSLAALAAAAAVGEELGLSARQIKSGIEAMQPFAGRMRPMIGLYNTTLIDDTYNAEPTAVVAALKTLDELPGRHIAIIGSMNELGDLAEAKHREVGLAAAKVDMLVTVGANAGKYLVGGATEGGLKPERIHGFDSPYKAGAFVKSQMKAGDVILAKGSQNGVFTEEALAQLLADPADRAKLVRQSPQWHKRKQAQFADAN